MNSMLFHLLERFNGSGGFIIEKCTVDYDLPVNHFGLLGGGRTQIVPVREGFCPMVSINIRLRQKEDASVQIGILIVEPTEQAALDQLEAQLEAAAAQ